ncbi:ERF family protein [Nostoc ellipsosporum NOK]|nr:ERF family protein [Nostoc ellipsosporum NOK]
MTETIAPTVGEILERRREEAGAPEAGNSPMNAQTPIEADAAVPAVYMAISNVMEQMSKEGIGKDRRNSQQGYNFRGIDDVYNTLCGVLAANKLMMLPFLVSMSREERQTQKGGVLNYTILTVDFKLVCAIDGSSDVVRMVGEAMDSADKSSNKAQSAALKYAAMQVFMIPTEGDNDADATTHDLAPRNQRQNRNSNGISAAQCAELRRLIKDADSSEEAFVEYLKCNTLPELPAARFEAAKKALNDRIARTKADKAEKPNPQTSDVLEDEIPY